MAIKFEDKDEPGVKRPKQPAPAPAAAKVASDEVPPKPEAKSGAKRRVGSGR